MPTTTKVLPNDYALMTWFTQDDKQALIDEAEATGLSRSAILRRALRRDLGLADGPVRP